MNKNGFDMLGIYVVIGTIIFAYALFKYVGIIH